MAIKRMLVDATHPEETRIVVTSGNRLEEFDFESAARRQLRGNIYLAKVTRVEPSLQAAFVEYGGNRHGFLAFSEIHPDYYQIPVADREALLAEQEQEDNDDTPEEAASTPAADTSDDADHDDEDHGDDEDHSSAENVESVGADQDAMEEIPQRKKHNARHYKIQEVIKRRQVILVQVVKEERGNKGAALTTYLSLAGRYSVLMPNTARGGGISRKITNATDRKRLKEIAGDLQVPEGMGIILRTAGASRTKAEVKRDFEYLLRLWENVRNLTLKSQAPCLVYEEGSLIKRTIRDLYNKDIDEVWVAGDEAYREAKDFMRMIMPSHAKNVQLYKDDQQIFSKYNVESQLDSMFSPQVTLPSGGYIVINPTEALVSIDVNSGRSTKEHNIEDTAYQTNLEAADEVARQLRLRDLAGLIVIDFIDMMEKRSVRNVERRLKDALRDDRARIQVGRISHFGLMEMSRQRMRFGVLESSTHVCPTCAGAGIVRSVESLSLMVMRAIEEHILKRKGQSINVHVPVDVALYILNAKRTSLTELEDKYELSITITADGKLSGNHFNIERGESRIRVSEGSRAAISADSTAITEVEEIEETEEEASEASSETGEGDGSDRPRRRRRRGGRNRNRRDGEARETATPEDSSEAGEAEAETQGADADGETTDENGDEPRKRRRRGRRGGRRNRRGEEGENGDTEAAAMHAVEGTVVTAHDPLAEAEAKGVPAAEVEASVAASAPAESAPEATAEPVAEASEEQVKKPRRTRRKKADVEAEAATEVSTEATPTVAAEAEGAAAPEATEAPAKAKPARTRKAPARKAKAEAPKDEAPASEAAASEAAAPEATEEAPAEKPKRGKRDLPDEGVIVVSSTANEPETKEEAPKRGGWWQKAFSNK